MTDLVDFLRAQIAEDRRVAEAATAGPWKWVDPGGKYKLALVNGLIGNEWVRVLSIAGEHLSSQDADHIATWDPARVLAECDAKERLVTLAAEDAHEADLTIDGEWGSNPDLSGDFLRALAVPYADRPGYQEDWRP